MIINNTYKKHVIKWLNEKKSYVKESTYANYSYIVYNFKKETETLQIFREFKGKPNKTKRKNINCLICKGINKYPDDKYMEALRKLYEQPKQ